MRPYCLLLWIFVLIILSTRASIASSANVAEPGSGEITEEQFFQTVKDASDFLDSLHGPDWEADSTALLQFLSSRSEFVASGISSDGTVWAQFADGEVLVFPEDPTAYDVPAPSVATPALRPAGRGEGARLAPHWTDDGARTVAVSAPLDTSDEVEPTLLPLQKNAVLMSGAQRPAYDCVDEELQDWLRSAAYLPSRFPPTVDNLMTVLSNSDVGVLYLCLHGFWYTIRTTVEGHTVEEHVYILRTSTPLTRETRRTYWSIAGLEPRSYVMGRGGLQDFGITADFIKTYMHLGDNSLVFVDGCAGFNDEFKSAFKAAHASVYVSRTAVSYAGTGTRYFFDRLLGINKVMKKTPPNRPFDWEAVLEAMSPRPTGNGLDTEWKGNVMSKLMGERLRDSFAILRPSISSVSTYLGSPDETPEIQLSILGLFGKDPGPGDGEVTVGSRRVGRIIHWEASNIQVALDDQVASDGTWSLSAGPVVVKVRGHDSNAVPLTLWHGAFTYVRRFSELGVSPPRLVETTTFDVYFRGDVHRHRLHRPDEPPTVPSEEFPLSPDLFLIGDKGSTANVECTGIEEQLKREPDPDPTNPNAPPKTNKYTIKLTGQVKIGIAGLGPDLKGLAIGSLYSKERRIRFLSLLEREQGLCTMTKFKNGDITSVDRTDEFGQGWSDSDGSRGVGFDDSFIIMPGSYPPEASDAGQAERLEWKEITPQYVPTDETEALLARPPEFLGMRMGANARG